MVIRVPHHYDIPESMKKEVLKKTDSSVPEWEISVPRRDDMAWSIVLSYLLATDYKSEKNVSKRLNSLTGSDEYAKLVNKSIRYFNPFRNRFSCFFDETMKRVVNDFKRKLNWGTLFRVSDKLTEASKLLSCPILLIWDKPENENYVIYDYESYDVKHLESRDGMLTLKTFQDYDNENYPVTVYNFMINDEIGSKMKNAALLYYLKEIKVYKRDIRKLNSIDGADKYFLIELLKNKCHDVILKLYKSPYIVSKISEAGYTTDPRARDNEGFSALHHAVVLENFHVTCILYYFAVNNCCQSEASYRNPDSSVVSNIHRMQEILSNDLSKLKDFKHHREYNKWKKTFEELLKFNKFLIEINSKILKIKNVLNYYERMKETIFEANKRRDIIVTLLDIYEKFFYLMQEENPTMEENLSTEENSTTEEKPLIKENPTIEENPTFEENPTMEENPNLCRLEDYISHRNYYNLIDMATVIIFFDNIIFLKERLTLENENQFSEIESSFLLAVYYHILFENTNAFLPSLQLNPSSFYIFLLIERLDNLDKIVIFRDILRSAAISDENVVSCIPQNEIYSTLSSYPEFKDDFHKERLQYYMKSALNVRITNVQSVLVIERALQVIGEYMVLEGDVNSFTKKFLYLCLPKEISHVLRRMRNELTHLKSHTFSSKFVCEKNLSLFRSIQKEILEIENHFKIVYDVLDLRSIIYVVKHLEKEFKRMKDVIHLYTKAPIETLCLDERITTYVKSTPHRMYNKYKHSFLCFFKMVLDRLNGDVIETFKHRSYNSHNFDDIFNQVKGALKPLKWLIEIIQCCYTDDVETDVETVLDEFQTLEKLNEKNCILNKFKEKTDIFIKKCTDFLSKLSGGCRKKKYLKPLKSLKNIEHFLKILKGFVFLSDEEKDKIRNGIPYNIKESILKKEKLIHSINNHFWFNLDEHPEFEISYLSKTKMKKLRELYQKEDQSALDILSPDPVEELEDIFSKNSVNKKNYDSLCKIMQFPEEIKEILGKLVHGQRKKNPGNQLSNLLNRIELLRKIVIEENEAVSRLWDKIKSQTSRQLISDKLIQWYLKDPQQQAAVDMLLFDCMILFENVKGIENPWIKTSKMYSGINMRNVISHGSPLLETLCLLLDPEDLPSEKIKIMLRLIDGEDAIKSILELFDVSNKDYSELLKIINSEEIDSHSNLRACIRNCNEWKDYVLLLPYNRTDSGGFL